jgi:hypothetical protein
LLTSRSTLAVSLLSVATATETPNAQ